MGNLLATEGTENTEGGARFGGLAGGSGEGWGEMADHSAKVLKKKQSPSSVRVTAVGVSCVGLASVRDTGDTLIIL